MEARLNRESIIIPGAQINEPIVSKNIFGFLQSSDTIRSITEKCQKGGVDINALYIRQRVVFKYFFVILMYLVFF